MFKPLRPLLNQNSANNKKIIHFSAILALGALWLCLARYHGFFHDALLYTTMALEKISPANYRNDLIIQFGSQGEFSAFPAVFAGIIRIIGLDNAAFTLTGCGQLLWFLGLYTLARRLNSHQGATIIGIACVVFFSRYYDSDGSFSYAEPFPTPRIFSEGLSLLALSAAISRHYIKAALLLVVAIALHPLMAGYTLLITNILFLCDQRINARVRIIYALTAATILGVLAAARVSAFAGFLVPFDDSWFEIIDFGEQPVLPGAWSTGSAYRIIFFLLILGFAQWRHRGSTQNWVFITCAIFLFAIWGSGSGIFHDQFITQLQPWRGIWLLQVLSLLTLGNLLSQLWPGTCAERWLAAFLTTALLQCGFVQSAGNYALTLGIAGISLYFILLRIPGKYTERAPWNLIPFLIPLPQLISNAGKAWAFRWSAPESIDANDWVAGSVWIMCILAFAILGFAAYKQSKKNSCRLVLLGAAMAMMSLLGGIFVWSAPFLTKTGDSEQEAAFLNTQLQKYIPEDSVVYSELGLRWTWFALQRSYYIDPVQLSGMVFSRGLAIEGLRRMSAVCSIGTPACPLENFHANIGPDRNLFWQQKIPALCRDTELDYLVLVGRIDNARIFEDRTGHQLSVVECAKTRVANSTDKS
jgi:hypothetical protein